MKVLLCICETKINFEYRLKRMTCISKSYSLLLSHGLYNVLDSVGLRLKYHYNYYYCFAFLKHVLSY